MKKPPTKKPPRRFDRRRGKGRSRQAIVVQPPFPRKRFTEIERLASLALDSHENAKAALLDLVAACRELSR